MKTFLEIARTTGFDLTESKQTLNESSGDAAMVEENSSRKIGETVIRNGNEVKGSTILQATKQSLLFVLNSGSSIIIRELTRSGDKNEVYLDKSMVKYIK